MAKLKEYNNDDDWLQYVERLEFYFEAQDITDGGKKRATLLSVCGAQTYKLICDLVAPQKPKDKTFDELKDVVQKHLKPKPSVIVQRYKFNTRGQTSGESVACFVAGLRLLLKTAISATSCRTNYVTGWCVEFQVKECSGDCWPSRI